MMNALEITNLTKLYKNGFQALHGVNLTVKAGDFYALLGHNGAGKSTTIGIVSSLINKTSGTVKVFGFDLDENPSQLKQHIGLVPQEFNFNQFEKVIDILTNQAGYYGIPYKEAKQRAEVWLKKLDLWDKRHNQAMRLSGGMKRRLMIARALMHEPKLLILDEPTAGVDIELRRSMWSFLQELNAQGTTIILTTHYLEEAEMLCRHIGIIQQGQLVVDMPMKTLLSQLETETFILDVAPTVDLQNTNVKSAVSNLRDYQVVNIAKESIEVEVHREQGLNGLFQQLSALNIQVLSMRNKANRLEELFVKMALNKPQGE